MQPANGVREPGQPARFADVRAGDTLVATHALLNRLPPGPHIVAADSEGDLYVDGGHGRVYLEHATRTDGTLTGLTWGPPR